LVANLSRAVAALSLTYTEIFGMFNGRGTSTVWDTQFDTDEQAFAEFRRTVEEEGMNVFLEDEKASNVIPFPRRH
jgi:hypothetical protein